MQRTLSRNKVQAGHRQRTWTGTSAQLSCDVLCILNLIESSCKLHNGQAGNVFHRVSVPSKAAWCIELLQVHGSETGGPSGLRQEMKLLSREEQRNDL